MKKEIRYCEICGVSSEEKGVHNHRDCGCVCDKHYEQFRRFGKFMDSNPRSVFDPNEIRLLKDYAEIDTYDQYGNVITTFKIDLNDVSKLDGHKWRTVFKNDKPYLFTGNQKSERIYFHRLIVPTTKQVDHISGDTSDNRKCNLREASIQENMRNLKKKCSNKSGIRGISFDSKRKNWKCDFTYNKMRIYIKAFPTIEEAVYARYLLEKEFLGKWRNESNDEEYLKHINNLKQTQKEEVLNYVKEKINSAKAGV